MTVEHLLENGPARGCTQEQRHGRSQLLRIDRPEDLLRAAGPYFCEDSGALDQPRAEHGMAQVGLGFLERRNGELSRHRAVPEPGDLGENKPHPVAALLAPSQFLDGTGVNPTRVLGGDKALQVERVSHMRDLSYLRPPGLARPRRDGAKPLRAKVPLRSEDRPAHENPQGHTHRSQGLAKAL